MKTQNTGIVQCHLHIKHRLPPPQFYGFHCNIRLLTWEPSAAQVTKSYSRRLPALKRFFLETKFLLLKSTHSF